MTDGGEEIGAVKGSPSRLDPHRLVTRLIEQPPAHGREYLAFYSTWYGGIVLEPGLMMVPLDDHMVHRGDGVFEAFKCVRRHLFALEEHLDRLDRSAGHVELSSPLSRGELIEVVRATVRAAECDDALVRLFLSRGPGGFTANPYECVGPQLFVAVTALRPPPGRKYEEGVTVRSSGVQVKPGVFAVVKSCNYLPNVLMKKEAVDAGVDFTLSWDEEDNLGEGAGENALVVTPDGRLLVPSFDRTLRGITATVTLELARRLVEEGVLKEASEAKISRSQVERAAEILIAGTTADLLPVVRFDDRPVGDGRPGPVYRRLAELFREELVPPGRFLTPVD